MDGTKRKCLPSFAAISLVSEQEAIKLTWKTNPAGSFTYPAMAQSITLKYKKSCTSESPTHHQMNDPE